MSGETITGTGNNLVVSGVAKRGSPSFLKQIFQWISLGALAIVSYLVVSHFIVQTVQVVGVSMVPTLQDSQKCVLNRWIYHFRAPKRNDLVVLRDPIDKSFAVKRVIATEGDHLVFKNGGVYVNGRKLAEPYLTPGMPTFPYSRASESFTLSKGQYFVLGDNRRNSADSRCYGPVPQQSILGLIIR